MTLDELDQLASLATPGPWEAQEGEIHRSFFQVIDAPTGCSIIDTHNGGCASDPQTDAEPTIPAPLPSDREIGLLHDYAKMSEEPECFGFELALIRRCHAAEQERDAKHRDIEGLNRMLRETGYGQGQIDSYVATAEELDAAKEELAAERAKVATLLAALLPFAKWYDVILHGGDTGRDLPYYNDLKRASTALKEGVTTNEAR